MRRYFILLLAGLISASASPAMAQTLAEHPLTRTSVEQMSPEETIRRVLGPLNELFVEREIGFFRQPCGNCYLQNITFCSKPQAIGVGICAASRLTATYEPAVATSLARPATRDTPVKTTSVEAAPIYSIVRRTDLPEGASGGMRATESICSGFMSASRFFSVDRPTDIRSALNFLNDVARQAQGATALPFAIACEGHAVCDSPRQFLATFGFNRIIGMRDAVCEPVTDTIPECYYVRVSDDVLPETYFDIGLFGSRRNGGPFEIERVTVRLGRFPPA